MPTLLVLSPPVSQQAANQNPVLSLIGMSDTSLLLRTVLGIVTESNSTPVSGFPRSVIDGYVGYPYVKLISG